MHRPNPWDLNCVAPEKKHSDKMSNPHSRTEHQEKSNNVVHESSLLSPHIPKKESVPLTPLHEAASVADLDRLMELLKSEKGAGDHTDLVDMRAGEMESIPLHLASMSSLEGADAC
eukprot:scaffold9908_cov61-Attheya_sp.AAC.1